jgi:hypothetical protein
MVFVTDFVVDPEYRNLWIINWWRK